MPTYEYRCTVCENQFEVFQSIKDDPIDLCPECGGKANKLLSAGIGLIFKGSGFYITDYKNNGNKSDKEEKMKKEKKKETVSSEKGDSSQSKSVEKSKNK